MKLKEIIRGILRTATILVMFVVLITIIGYSYKYIGQQETFWDTTFWSVACFLTAIKISFIKEDF